MGTQKLHRQAARIRNTINPKPKKKRRHAAKPAAKRIAPARIPVDNPDACCDDRPLEPRPVGPKKLPWWRRLFM